MFAEPVLDDIIFRGVAKIAFNFLANMLGVSFALRKEFDGVRDYIRLGRKTHSLVTVKRVSNLKHDDGISRRPGGHCVIVTRALFDHLTYEVVLSERYPTIWYPLNYGRDFDLQAQRISQLEEQVQ